LSYRRSVRDDATNNVREVKFPILHPKQNLNFFGTTRFRGCGSKERILGGMGDEMAYRRISPCNRLRS
jgi:hypothetical protein